MFINEAIVKSLARHDDAIYISRRTVPDMYAKGDMYSPLWKYHRSGERMSAFCLSVEDLMSSDWDVFRPRDDRDC